MNDTAAATVQIVCPHCMAANRVPGSRLAEHPNCGKCHEPLFDGHPVVLDDARFERFVSRTGVPVVVDVWAPWCGPCRAFAPVFEQAARELEPRFRFVKLDSDQNPQTSQRFAIRSIPTLLLMRDGKEVKRMSGALPYDQFKRWLTTP